MALFDPPVKKSLPSDVILDFRTDELAWLPLEELEADDVNVRNEIGEIRSLCESVKRYGVLEPIIVRNKDKKFKVIIGKRRLLAARRAGLPRIPARIVSIQDNEALIASLVENLQRNNLSLRDEIQAYRRLMKADPLRFGSTRKLGTALGVSHVTVEKRLAAGEILARTKARLCVSKYASIQNEARKHGSAIPIEHLQMLATALKVERHTSLDTRKFDELIHLIAPLRQWQVKKIVSILKANPTISVLEINRLVGELRSTSVRCQYCGRPFQLLHGEEAHVLEAAGSHAPRETISIPSA